MGAGAQSNGFPADDGRAGKKRRRRHRVLIDDTFSAIAESEQRSDDGREIGEEDFKRREFEGLIEEAHFDLFIDWLAFGGPERGLTPLELLEMPPAMVTDFKYLLRELGINRRRAREKRRARDAQKGRRR